MNDKDVIIARQQREIEELRELVLQLRDKIAKLEKNSSNSSQPPSSDIVDPQPGRKKKKKRKIGGQKGHPKHSRQPFADDEIDRTIIHKLPAKEVQRRGLIPLDETESALQQIDLPEQLFDVIEHRVQLYVDPRGKIVKAKIPRDIRKAGLFSPRMIALTGYLNTTTPFSFSKYNIVWPINQFPSHAIAASWSLHDNGENGLCVFALN